jgi:predicted HicB family RNase H-like nuclease
MKEIEIVNREEIELRSGRLLTQIEPSLLELVSATAQKKGISIGEFVRFSLIRGVKDLTGTNWNPINPDGSKSKHA